MAWKKRGAPEAGQAPTAASRPHHPVSSPWLPPSPCHPQDDGSIPHDDVATLEQAADALEELADAGSTQQAAPPAEGAAGGKGQLEREDGGLGAAQLQAVQQPQQLEEPDLAAKQKKAKKKRKAVETEAAADGAAPATAAEGSGKKKKKKRKEDKQG